jgi:hypothetical protein
MASKQVSATMTKVGETKGTWRYKEENDGRKFRQIYLNKTEVVKELGLKDGDEIEVIVRKKS